MESKAGNHLVWLSEMKTIMYQALEKSEKGRHSRVTEMTEMQIIDALEMRAVEGRNGAVRSVASLAKRSVIGNVLDKDVVCEKVHKVALKFVVQLVVIQANTGALLKKIS